MRRAALVLASVAGIALAGPATAGAATFTVQVAADEAAVPPVGDGVCDSDPSPAAARCSLRAAVQEANALPGGDSIVVPALAGDYDLTLTGPGEDLAASGDLDVTGPVEIRGEGQPVIDGLFADRVLHIGPGPGSPAVTVSGLELRDGASVSRGGGLLAEGGALTLERVSVAGSTADAGPGTGEGGGIWLDGGAHSISASTLSENAARGGTAATGGGLGLEPGTSLTLVNSTVSLNAAESGSGAAAGGGLYTGGTSTSLAHVTMDGNRADGDAGSFGGNVFGYGGGVLFRATIVSAGVGDPGAEQCETLGGGLNSLGSNLEAPAVGGASQCGFAPAAGDRLAATAGLTPLADRGGPTLTHALFSSSPALDAIPSCFPYTTDQRGQPRPGGVACEIGSFERQEAVPAGATCFGRRPTIVGRKGVLRILGTPGADVILGSVSSELIKAKGGKDLICAGKGKDRVKAGESRDRVSGEEGEDRLFGQGGKDELRGDRGRDFLDGGPGRDALRGGEARDTCRPSAADRLRGC